MEPRASRSSLCHTRRISRSCGVFPGCTVDRESPAATRFATGRIFRALCHGIVLHSAIRVRPSLYRPRTMVVPVFANHAWCGGNLSAWPRNGFHGHVFVALVARRHRRAGNPDLIVTNCGRGQFCPELLRQVRVLSRNQIPVTRVWHSITSHIM